MRSLNYKGLFMLWAMGTFCSCKQGPTEKDLNLLNGYWEITEVVFANGDSKAYGANLTVDYFYLENHQGYRKKVSPKLNGSFETSDDAQPFILAKENNGYSLRYSNDLSSWNEQLTQLNRTEMALKNQEGTVYYYARYEPIDIP